MFKFEKYLQFLNSEGLLPQVFGVVAGMFFTNIIQQLVDKVVDPIAKGDKPTLNIKKFSLEIFNFIFATYVLFLLADYIKKFKI